MMCLAIPGRIKSIEGTDATVDYDGICKRASLRLMENASVGDIVLVHAGFVIQVMDEDAGTELKKLVDETIFLLKNHEI